jgi:hypothetical protein
MTPVIGIRRSATCRGLVGIIFGHKFVHGFDRLAFRDHCFRCGMPEGGWTV